MDFEEIDWESLTSLQLPASTIYMVLKNLIENAYLHAHSNTVIQIFMQYETLIIQDQGVGLNDAELNLLTKRFWRKSAQNTGHGLGLSLVSVLLNKHAYQIEFMHNIPTGLKVVISKI